MMAITQAKQAQKVISAAVRYGSRHTSRHPLPAVVADYRNKYHPDWRNMPKDFPIPLTDVQPETRQQRTMAAAAQRAALLWQVVPQQVTAYRQGRSLLGREDLATMSDVTQAVEAAASRPAPIVSRWAQKKEASPLIQAYRNMHSQTDRAPKGRAKQVGTPSTVKPASPSVAQSIASKRADVSAEVTHSNFSPSRLAVAWREAYNKQVKPRLNDNPPFVVGDPDEQAATLLARAFRQRQIERLGHA